MVSLPKRYFTGLSNRQKTLRKKEIFSRSKLSWKNPRAYRPFKTDQGQKTRRSKYTLQWRKKFPQAKTVRQMAKVTGVPERYVRQSYNRGLAAWRTGHRPGAGPEQWGYARARSMLLCGKTYRTTDSDLVRTAKQKSKTAKNWFKKTCE
jgi:hypothetical protein